MNDSPTATWADVLALVAQLDESGLEEAEVVTEGVSVRVSRTPGGLRHTSPASSIGPAVPVAQAAPEEQAPVDAELTPDLDRSDLIDLTAPMLGVLYHRPAPDKEPFVRVGDVVEPETTVAIIEVMKLMNPVHAGVSGVVVEVVAPDGTLVEHGQVILRLEPLDGSGA